MSNTGVITQVIGSTFDAQFPEDQLPEIYNAISIEHETRVGPIKLTGEVQKHLGGGRVRCVALGSTDGLARGSKCVDKGSPVTVPVGEQVLGRVFNLLGDAIDNPRRGFPTRTSAGPFTPSRPPSISSTPRPKSSRPASRSSTCSARSSVVARSACSVVPASARPSSSRR